MPGFNQQGPNNEGPMTGRGMGRCATGPIAGSSVSSGPVERGLGRGFRRGRGMRQGRGVRSYWRQGFDQAPLTAGGSPIMEDLELRAEMLESELNVVRQRMTALSKSSDTDK